MSNERSVLALVIKSGISGIFIKRIKYLFAIFAVKIKIFFIKQYYIGIFLPLIIITLWQIASAHEWVDRIFLPKPLDVIRAFWYMLWQQELLNDVKVSVSIVSQGFIYGSIAAIFLGISAGLSRKAELFFGSTLNTIRHIPTIAWLPLIVVWLGLGAPAKILIIAKSVFFPVFLNVLQAIRSIDKSYIELAEVLKLSKWQLVRKVIIPAILPSIAVSFRYSAGLAWAIVVIAEGLSGLEGLGFLIFRAQQLLMTDQLLVCMVLIGLIGFAIDRSMYGIQRRLLRWKAGFDAS
ncbi:MAG: ABC transporter permease [Campylobacteraceae bacterium]|jgi:sulfonate transport system permease protein|nr:ABC transporter permease [Campylobacteraceae bacterium]